MSVRNLDRCSVVFEKQIIRDEKGQSFSENINETFIYYESGKIQNIHNIEEMELTEEPETSKPKLSADAALTNLTNHLDTIMNRKSARIRTETVNQSCVNTAPKRVRAKIKPLIESFKTVNLSYSFEYYTNLLQLHEFLNVYIDYLGLRETFPNGIKLEYLESAIVERDSAKLYQLMFIFLATIFKYHSVECDEYDHSKSVYGVHTVQYYECEIDRLPCDEFTISEILRLYLLSSRDPLRVKKGGFIYDDVWDISCAKQALAKEFIQNHSTIIQSLHHDTIYRLPSGDLLKIFTFLLNQILMFDAIRKQIEGRLDLPPNYLGCDHNDRKYWRFDSLPGVYIECSDTWKYIDTVENVYLLIEALPRSVLKKNLNTYGDIIGESIAQSGKRSKKDMINGYNLKHFTSINNWDLVWLQKWANFQDLFQKLDVISHPENNMKLFENNFFNWIIPRNETNSAGEPIQLSQRQNFTIERLLCKVNNIPQVEFSTADLSKIRKLASKIAYTYYLLDEKSTWKTEHNRLTRERKFESFLRIESVSELFLNLYKLYEDLSTFHGKCHICHSDRKRRSIKCSICDRSVHARCLENVPILTKPDRRLCDVCQFRFA